MNHRLSMLMRTALALMLGAGLLHVAPEAQDRLKEMPGYGHYQKISPEIASAVQIATLQGLTWAADAKSFEYNHGGRRYRYDVNARRAADLGVVREAGSAAGRGGRGGQGGIDRGRQAVSAESPDRKWKAFYRDRNLWLSEAAGGGQLAITTDGNETDRIKYGTASWVYGEELNQRSAIWWSPDSRKVAFYRFDESQVPDYFLQLDQTRIQSRTDIEAYPKAGAPNPGVEVLVYDIASRTSTRIDVRDGGTFDNAVVGHYVYRISWSSDGRELLFNRTNRRQNILEFVAADPDTGATRVILREEWPTGWVQNNPPLHFLGDGRRFIWQSERNGWANLYLWDLSGRLIAPLTTHTSFEVGGLVKVDEEAGVMFYTARSGDNHLKLQLHRVGLDGKGDVRLTDPAFHHTVGSCMSGPASGGRGGAAGSGGGACGISPDNQYFVALSQTHNTPPAMRLVDAAGRVVAEIVRSDLAKFEQLGLRQAEMFTFTAADGRTTLRGLIQFPSTFDPSRKYPVLVPVYGGPASASNTARETFVTPSPVTELGFLVVHVDSRAVPGMGKRQLDSLYLKLGLTEIDDMAEGIRALSTRPYVDSARIGVYGTSYGGYAALMLLLRHPDLFAAASASSPVTSWYHYDTIYTERYMWIPQENKEGYEAGSAMNYVKNLRGRLMLYYGTADNNVHPSNTMQLIAALQQAGKSFDVQVGPDRGHTGINTDRMMEFFAEHLLLKPAVHTSTH